MKNYYDEERKDLGKDKITEMKIHTDCCGPQYRCRENFLKITTSKERLAVIVVHKFAQKYCFKGSWDATGKLITDSINKHECRGERCANAENCSTNLG